MKLFTKSQFVLTFLLLLPCFVIIAQDLDEKMDDVKGDINKITITADGKDYIFEGKDAEKLFDRMKLTSLDHSFVWNDSGDDNGKNKVVIVQSDGDGNNVKVVQKRGENLAVISSDDNIKKKIEVENENGNKKVTVTTNENGEEKTEVYEGKEAEKYLNEMEDKYDCHLEMNLKEDCDHHKKMKKIIIEKQNDSDTDEETETE